MERWEVGRKRRYYENKMREYGCSSIVEYKALMARQRTERGKRNGGKRRRKPETPRKEVKLTAAQREELWQNIFEILEEGGVIANLPIIEN